MSVLARFRQNHLWYLAHQYCELELVRTAKLDPARKYIFAVYPHGILIISRIGLYGGTFERLFPGIDTRSQSHITSLLSHPSIGQLTSLLSLS